MTYIIINKDGLIINRIELENPSDYEVSEEFSIFEETELTNIGGTYVDGVYTPPNLPEDIIVISVSKTVTPRQARLALLQAGLLDQVEAAVNQAGGATKITWDYATEINRNDPLIDALGQSLGLTEEQIDNLFTQAATL